MYRTVPLEAAFFLASFGAGVVSAFVFDLLRLSRRLRKPSVALVNVEDVLFLVFLAVVVLGVAYFRNSGEIRWQGFLGTGFGAVLYAVIVKNHFVDVGAAILRGVFWFFGKVVRILLFPLRLILGIFRRPVRILVWHTGRGARWLRRIFSRMGDKIRLNFRKVGFILRKK